MIQSITLSSLHRYPVKSCRGQSAAGLQTDRYGLEGDRRWMLVTPEGDFLSQRQIPRMALIEPTLATDGLWLAAPGVDPLRVTGHTLSLPASRAQVWKDTVAAADAGEEAAAWLSTLLEVTCRLVGMHARYHRSVDPERVGGDHQVSFADGFSFLLISEASLVDLNSRLDTSLPMNRFRPNLVVSGCEAFAEDRWKRIRIGDTEFTVAKPCARCAITTTDQSTGRRAGKEPLRTLARYRRLEGGSQVFFGQNLVHLNYPGTLKVGQVVEVVA